MWSHLLIISVLSEFSYLSLFLHDMKELKLQEISISVRSLHLRKVSFRVAWGLTQGEIRVDGFSQV